MEPEAAGRRLTAEEQARVRAVLRRELVRERQVAWAAGMSPDVVDAALRARLARLRAADGAAWGTTTGETGEGTGGAAEASSGSGSGIEAQDLENGVGDATDDPRVT